MIPAAAGGGGGSPYFLQQQQQQLFHHDLDAMDGGAGVFMDHPPPAVSESAADAHCHALLYNLSVLRDKVHQLQPLVGLAVAHDGPGPVAAVSSASAVIQEIMTAASSMMYAFQQLCTQGGSAATAQQQAGGEGHNSIISVARDAKSTSTVDSNHHHQQQHQAAVIDHHAAVMQQQWQQQLNHGHGGAYGDHHRRGSSSIRNNSSKTAAMGGEEEEEEAELPLPGTIIELDAAELLAKYTHYCQVCGKGFKRDANLRMHMRAHGDEYKSSAALANPAKAAAADTAAATSAATTIRSYYSCPAEGCRWNRKHAKFQPLKSVICAKNHYKRSHCPKMYVCNRCNRKHFSVLSDLRTHEKHCGDHRWLCSCGTSFSRKDKLVGHLALFAGHRPAVPLDRQPPSNAAKIRSSSSSTQQL